jgi:hypothetical protein
VHASVTACEDVDLAFLFQELDIDALAHLRPRLGEKRLLQLAQPPLGCPDEVAHRCVSATHRGETVLGRDTAVHDPNALGLAILLFDLGEEVLQRGLVAGVARQDLVGQGKALRGHDQGDDNLDAIGALVTTVAVLAFAVLRRLAFEIGAGQIVEQHIEADIEQHPPALLQRGEQRLVVRQQLVQTAIKGLALGDGEVLAEQISHGAAIEPIAVQSPLAARINEPIGDQGFQHVQPARPLATRGQMRLPESIQTKLTPKLASEPARINEPIGDQGFQHVQPARPLATRGQMRLPESIQTKLTPKLASEPARTPLTRPVQLQPAQPDLHHIAIQRGCCAIFRKQRHLRWCPLVLVEHLDRLAPRRLLRIVDLPEVEHLVLHYTPVGDAAVLNDTPVPVLLAVFEAVFRAQKHADSIGK